MKFLCTFFLVYSCLFQRIATAQPSLTLKTKAIEAESMVSAQWKRWPDTLPSWHVRFRSGRKGYLGTADEPTRKISIFVRLEHTPEDLARTMLHELAHAFDCDYLDDRKREEWLVMRKLPAETKWLGPSMKSDFSFGSGDFAECLAWTLLGEGSFKSKLGPPPTAEQQELIRRWLFGPPPKKVGD
jgi:hypothetical protein